MGKKGVLPVEYGSLGGLLILGGEELFSVGCLEADIVTIW